jgi:glycosyltransferase involved in cell wall biosynthesis
MKIAYLLKYFPRLSETFIEEEINQLSQAGEQLFLHSLLRGDAQTHERLQRVLQRCSLKTHGTSFTGRLRNFWGYPTWVSTLPELALRVDFRSIHEELARQRPQLLHCHFLWERAELTARLARALDLPFTVTAHARDLFLPNRRRILRVAQVAGRLITISQANRKLLISMGVAPEQVEVIHCGVDPARFVRRKRAPGPVRRLLSVGRLVEKKGFVQLIQALQRLHTAGKLEHHLQIIGDGPLRGPLEHQVREAGLGAAVVFHGALPQEQIAQHLSAADLFVLPCVRAADGDQDGIPVSLMEALAVGVPVLSTRLSGIPELVEDGVHGRLVEPDDVEALAQALSNFPVLPAPHLPETFTAAYQSRRLQAVFAAAIAAHQR